MSQADECCDESSPETSEKIGGGDEIKTETVDLKPSTSQGASKIVTDTIFGKIGKLFQLKTGGMVIDLKLNIATGAFTSKTELKLDSASLKAIVEKNVNELKSDINELKSSNASLKADVEKNVNELKSDNASLKADVEKNVMELKLDMKTAIKISRDEIMDCVGAFEHVL